MATKGAKQAATGRALIDGVQVATPVKIKLDTLHDIRREMARVYRECRSGKLDLADGSKLSYMLQGLVKVVEASVIEDRLKALENDTVDTGDGIEDVDYVEVQNVKSE